MTPIEAFKAMLLDKEVVVINYTSALSVKAFKIVSCEPYSITLWEIETDKRHDNIPYENTFLLE